MSRLMSCLVLAALIACAPAEDTSTTREDSAADSSTPQDSAAPEDSGTPADPWAELRASIDASALQNVTVLIGTAEGTQFSHTRGDIGPDDTLLIASASKWLAAITILAAVEDGILALDDTPQDHLSWWTTSASDSRSRTTLEQLLSFTSGLTGGVNDVPCVEDGDSTIEACAQTLYQDFYAYEPGTHFVYGPGHLQIAGAMLTATTGQTFHRQFRNQVGDDLGLDALTGFGRPSLANPRVASGATASANDYGRVLTALLAGDLLSQASVDQMVLDHTGDGVTMAILPELTATEQAQWHYALGCWRECNEAPYSAACDAPGVISSPGALGFYPWWDMEHGLWGVVAVQLVVPGSAPEITVPLGQQWSAMAVHVLGASAP